MFIDKYTKLIEVKMAYTYEDLMNSIVISDDFSQEHRDEIIHSIKYVYENSEKGKELFNEVIKTKIRSSESLDKEGLIDELLAIDNLFDPIESVTINGHNLDITNLNKKAPNEHIYREAVDKILNDRGINKVFNNRGVSDEENSKKEFVHQIVDEIMHSNGEIDKKNLLSEAIDNFGSVTINYKENDFYISSGFLRINGDLDFLNDHTYFSKTGKLVEGNVAMVLVHEFIHMVTGLLDPKSHEHTHPATTAGDTVDHSNTIYRELGIEEQRSYGGQIFNDDAVAIGHEYTNGQPIDVALYGDRWNTSNHSLEAKDLLVGTNNKSVLIAGEGNDFLHGRGGDDILNGGPGADYFDGGEGIDTIGYRSSSTGVTANLQNSLGNFGDAEGDSYHNAENVIGSEFNDMLIGNHLDNELKGRGGDDQLFGHEGSDKLYGDDGSDSLYGGQGNDTLHGGAGRDVLNGGSGIDTLMGDQGSDVLNGGTGDDRLHGGAGNDKLHGGAGKDSFLFRLGDGHDQILDFTPAAQSPEQLSDDNDAIIILGINSIRDFNDLMQVAEQKERDVVFHFSNTDSLTLPNTNLAALSRDDFTIA